MRRRCRRRGPRLRAQREARRREPHDREQSEATTADRLERWLVIHWIRKEQGKGSTPIPRHTFMANSSGTSCRDCDLIRGTGCSTTGNRPPFMALKKIHIIAGVTMITALSVLV